MHLIKLSDRNGGDALHRIHEQEINDQDDIAVTLTLLRIELLKAKREKRHLTLELWTEHREQPHLNPPGRIEDFLRMVRSNPTVNCT